jgi:protein CpxP
MPLPRTLQPKISTILQMTKAHMHKLTILRGSALALLLLPSIALAQSAPGAPQAAAMPLSGATAVAMDQRIAALKAQLGIAPAQLPAWDAFAKTMRDNAADTDTLFAQRAADASKMSAVENMHSYASIARSYADDTARLSTAFDTLYTSLSDRQKLAADVLFREQATAAQSSTTKR